MIDLDIFSEFDNAIRKVDKEIMSLKLKQKNNKQQKNTNGIPTVTRAHSFSTASPDSGRAFLC